MSVKYYKVLAHDKGRRHLYSILQDKFIEEFSQQQTVVRWENRLLVFLFSLCHRQRISILEYFLRFVRLFLSNFRSLTAYLCTSSSLFLNFFFCNRCILLPLTSFLCSLLKNSYIYINIYICVCVCV